jgi:hypothetical protein
MKADIAKKWVEALRSGEYKQAQHRLRGYSGFCCLGVLCDLVKDEVGGKWLDEIGDNTTQVFVVSDEDSRRSTVPRSVCKFVGLQDSFGEFRDDDVGDTSLANMNDNGSTFEEIADTIEKYAEVL